MSEVASFGNIVDSLLALRQNYHEELKAVPQYEAYLLVESSTAKASGALHGSAESPASIAAEVIDSLQFARSRFEQLLNSVPEYRTLLAIDKLIKEISIDLGITKPEQAHAPDVSGAEIAAPAPDLLSVAPATPVLDDPAVVAAAAAEAEEAEVTPAPPAETPVPPMRVMAIDIDGALAEDDDIVPVQPTRREQAVEGAEDEDLLEIAYRDVATAAEATASAKEGAEDANEPHTAPPPQPKMFDEDTDEAAA